MVTWDTSWSFTINYVTKYPKAAIAYIKVKEYTSGKEYSVVNGGSVTVNEERVRIRVGLKNVGEASGTLYAQVFIDGMKGTQKSTSVGVGSTGEVYWDVELTPGSHTIKVQVGH